MERKRLTENLRDYYESEILGKSIILRDLLNIEFPLNALTNELGEYLGYDEEDFTKEELGSRVIVTDIYTDADSFIGAEIKFENRDLIENKRLNKDRLELIWEVNPNDIYQQLDIRDIQKAKRNRRMGGEDETGSGGFWDLAFEETLSYLFHEVGLTDLTNAEHREYTLLAEDVYNVLVDNEENYDIVRKPTLYENKRLNKDRHELIRKVNPNSVVRQIDVLDLKKALRSRRSGGDDEQGSGGLWDLAFEETLNYIFYEIGLTDLTDEEHHEYTLLAEEVYNILVFNSYVFNNEENDINIGTVVKILQKNAPYNSYGKIGTVVDIDYEEAEMWYQVQFDKPNPETPYETWVREQDLQVLNENTLNENKTLTEAEETGFTIEYPNGDFYIGKPMDLYVLMTDFLINWDEDKTTMTEYEAENVASIRENYEEVFYAALEGGNYWEGQEFEETFGRFSDYGIADALSINENKTLTEALDYNEELNEVIFELYYERIEDEGSGITELEDARKLLKTYNLNFKEEVKRGFPVFVIQDKLDKIVDFIADYMGYYGEELIEMLQYSVQPVGGGEIPEEELFILATIKGLL